MSLPGVQAGADPLLDLLDAVSRVTKTYGDLPDYLRPKGLRLDSDLRDLVAARRRFLESGRAAVSYDPRSGLAGVPPSG